MEFAINAILLITPTGFKILPIGVIFCCLNSKYLLNAFLNNQEAALRIWHLNLIRKDEANIVIISV